MENQFVFDDVEELVTYIIDKVEEDNPVTVLANKNLVVEIMGEFLSGHNIALNDCDIQPDYHREYAITLEFTDDYWKISIYPAYNSDHNKYLGQDGYVLFHEDINSKALVDLQNNDITKMTGHDWFMIGEDDSFESDGEEENNQKDEEIIEDSDENSNREYTITVKCNVDPGDVMTLVHMYEMFDEMNMLRRLLGW